MLTKNSKDMFFQKCRNTSNESIENAQRIVGSSLLELRYMAEGDREEQVAYEAIKRAERFLTQAKQEVEQL
ncbi:hypothetical protein [Lactococcus petauri]|uniref:hypothetical protein n=1 Tax=Lactococcus petauri TaxID=1940789 RepID=UPI0013FDEB55|nr:hypothetical protein [Lactococcus petauri]NHI79918.1 hypothetical protein [Lactococcus petauri]NHJ19060.1 hypothetical protein [Lactococcus garvieae]